MTEVTHANLTPANLFAAPGLRKQPPTQMRIAPSGKFVAYLKASAENSLQMDLWRYDIEQQVHTLWVSAATFERKRSVQALVFWKYVQNSFLISSSRFLDRGPADDVKLFFL